MDIINKYLNENVIPLTTKKAKQLSNLFKRPIQARFAVDDLYDLIGDNQLFSEIQKEMELSDPMVDVRGLIADWLQKHWISKMDKINWKTPWDSEALEIVKNIVKKKKYY